MKAKIYVTLKPGVLDTQGQAVGATLSRLGYEGVGSVRVGKYLEVELEGEDREAAKERVARMCDELLANTVIENYRVEID